MESHLDDSYFSASKGPSPFVFVIDFSDSGAIEPAASAGKRRHSIVVQIEPEDGPFTLSATEPEGATRSFAEALAQRTAFPVVEKDFPNGVEPSLCAELINHIPAEFENRLLYLCVNGNSAWLVDDRVCNAGLLFARKQMRPGYG